MRLRAETTLSQLCDSSYTLCLSPWKLHFLKPSEQVRHIGNTHVTLASIANCSEVKLVAQPFSSDRAKRFYQFAAVFDAFGDKFI
jgi:hypothetical protein